MNWIKSKIVMLPTEGETLIYLDSYNSRNMCYGNKPLAGLLGLYLYFTSDEEIKEGDWMIREFDKAIIRDNVNSDNRKGERFKKIIATTDPKLSSRLKIGYTEQDTFVKRETILPQPSQDFIKEYCDASGIDEVMIEMEKSFYAFAQHGTKERCFYKVKTDHNNTINIRKIKDSWSREEMEKEVIDFSMEYSGMERHKVVAQYKKWKENGKL